MSDHISYIKQVSQKPLKRLEQELAKTIISLSPHIESIRVKKINNGPVNRVYVKTNDTGVLATVGWVVNDDIRTCMSCPNTFGLFTWKHHCRACGNLVCNNCSNKQSLLLGAEQLGQQRICNECCSKQGAKLALPVRVFGSIDWGKPLGSQDTNSEASDDDESESEPSTPVTIPGVPRPLAESGKRGSMLQISSVDERTVSQANDNSQQHAALIGLVVAEEKETTPVAPAPVAGVMVPAFNSNQFITLAMVSFNNSELADRKQVRSLKATATTHPKILLGWQVTTEVHVKPESIFVIVDIRKNASRKTEFKLVNVNQKLETKVVWTLLKRSEAKQGLEFVPMRKVLWTGDADITKNIKMVEDKEATPRN